MLCGIVFGHTASWRTIRYSIQYKYSNVHYNNVQFNNVQYNTVQCSKVHYSGYQIHFVKAEVISFEKIRMK